MRSSNLLPLTLLIMPWSLCAQTAKYPWCQADQLSLRLNSEGGAFDGMSHSGTLLTLRNNGSKPCEISAFLPLSFADSSGKLDIRAQSNLPPHVHPGPVVPPVPILPAAEVTATLEWVSGPVYDRSVCLDPTRLSVSINDKPLTVSFHGHLCGDRVKGVFYRLSRFAPPAPAKQARSLGAPHV